MKALDYMIEEDLYQYSADTWGSDLNAEIFWSLEDVNGQVNYKDEIFVVSQHSGGGAGMGSYPASVKILRIKLDN